MVWLLYNFQACQRPVTLLISGLGTLERSDHVGKQVWPCTRKDLDYGSKATIARFPEPFRFR